MLKIFQLLLTLCFVQSVTSQASQWVDAFQKTLCHDRWAQMDWQSILRPCRDNMEFGKNKYEDKKRTSPKWSHTLGLHFKKTGEFSKIGIQSRTGDGHNKLLGGDTWRIFIRGADNIVPFVSDLNNGVYEAKFVAMNPGFYKAEIVLQSTLCEAFKNPPQDWLKRDANTIISDEKNAKFLWTPLRGGNISFKIEDSSKETKNELRRSFRRWKDSCGPQYTCNMLWHGFGRWTNSSWIPYVRDASDNDIDERCLQKSEGLLKLTGDELTKQLYDEVKNSTLCNGGLFLTCEGEKPGEQPDIKAFEKRKIEVKKFKTSSFLKTLKKLLSRKDMDENSALLLTYGLPFVENMSFKKFRTFIDRAVRILSEKYKGTAIWRTVSSKWRDSSDPAKYFGNHQRIQLFNAYATSAMCNAGIPVLDVFQMSESVPGNNKRAVVKTMEDILTNFLRQEKTKNCDVNIPIDASLDNSTATAVNVTIKNQTSNLNETTSPVNHTQASPAQVPNAPTVSYTSNYATTSYVPPNYVSTVAGFVPYVMPAYPSQQIKSANTAAVASFAKNPTLYASTPEVAYHAPENAELYSSTTTSQTAEALANDFSTIQKTTATSRDNLIENFLDKSKRQEMLS